MSIDDRKIKILQAIINDYIRTGDPVGSRTIAKNYDLGIGSATIRNEMADLEDMGYLEQPHASAGRIPSSKGYRLYVDKLMDNQRLTEEEDLKIKQYIIDSAMLEVDKIVRQTSALLSELTKLTCVIETPSVKKSFVKSIQLIKVDEHNIVSVFLTDTGLIKNHIMKLINKAPDVRTLTRINEVINNRLVGLSIEQINLEVINNLKRDLGEYEEIFNAILPILYETLNVSDSSEVFMEGATNIFNYPEYNDINKAKEMLSLLNDKETILDLFNPQEDITISIGDENYKPQAKECSIISAEYSFGNRPIGKIGLIGPRRINYSKVITIMAEVIKELNNILNNQKI
ncbi:heat-inducible transcriptional repressor HrcA [Clostridium saccharobutylicum]|uniref:Heat-inducible transcription repressor HrcA n=1 Tax=Clostridium saccharobutylicum DSM 13864 TaxID=1345695 RepID=U5MNC2_CLOSA|nr:heat-inducible transcriptional repressor HrcA [Clostridium saccharobutylicum]AGX42090.1 heat-inducible transcription repressor HrcA [Clostridium saccharobutylicum DSM 13864]AQR89367.1 heat-inducible transcription repressor HrcA [Clostridium saccharobutylicum]AQR99269.1 heat-inducible transcription repressor HrcA [Clostridium saccharobutylicum]AQS13255.1 heat-inducible transcription repressor HrcA [Clostridium saccharobutylicum]MBA2904557.1 heat-inducible transcriptional repressor [Clostridi